jgi:hypothetical protein
MEYLLSVFIGLANDPSNIVWVVLLDQPDTHGIFPWCIHWLGRQANQYCLGGTVRSAGYTQNIHLVYLLVTLMTHSILSGWYYQISLIHTEYPLGVSISQADSPSNIVWVVLTN